MDDVGGVVYAAYAYFDDGYVDLLGVEVPKGEGCCHFKKLWPVLVQQVAVLLAECNDGLFGDVLPVEANPLTEVCKVRAGEKSCFATCFLQDG